MVDVHVVKCNHLHDASNNVALHEIVRPGITNISPFVALVVQLLYKFATWCNCLEVAFKNCSCMLKLMLNLIVVEIYRIYPKLIKEKRKMSTCNQSDLQTLGSQPVITTKNLPDHWTRFTSFSGFLPAQPFTKSSNKMLVDHERQKAVENWVMNIKIKLHKPLEFQKNMVQTICLRLVSPLCHVLWGGGGCSPFSLQRHSSPIILEANANRCMRWRSGIGELKSIPLKNNPRPQSRPSISVIGRVFF